MKELLEQAAEYEANMQPELAKPCYKVAIEKEPENTEVLDQYADFKIQLGEIKEAHEMLLKSITLQPESCGEKYLSYAETLMMHQEYVPEEAVEARKKGIELMAVEAEKTGD